MSLWIAGLGTAVPPHVIRQEDASAAADAFFGPWLEAQGEVGRRLLTRLYRNSGVATRHSVVLEGSTSGLPVPQSFYPFAVDQADEGPTTSQRMRAYEKEAPGLACEAAATALADARVPTRNITHLITVSCSGFFAPGCDVALIRKLGLSPRVARTHVGFMGCHGALNALRVAKGFTDADPHNYILLCAVELCSLHYGYGVAADKLLANALFADGAAALVARGGPADKGWSLAGCGSAIMPDSEAMMTWSIRDHGFEMSLSPQVPEAIHAHLRPWLEEWLAEHSLTVADVGSWAIHPGGPKILAACMHGAGLQPEQIQMSEDVLARYGNMSSATVLFVLDGLRRKNAARPCVALGFGPGLAMEAALFQ